MHLLVEKLGQCAASFDTLGIVDIIQAHPHSNLLKVIGFRHIRNLIHCAYDDPGINDLWMQIVFHIIKL
jgi:hypothetical protein